MFQQGMPGEGTPTPELVAAWLMLDTLPAEYVPRWAASWLAQGNDGESLAALAGLDGRDTREVRDVLPAALEDAGVADMSAKQAAVKVAYDHVAHMHLTGRAGWRWVVGQVVDVVTASGYAEEVFGQPLAGLWGIDDELGQPWGKTDDDLARVVHDVCTKQIGRAPSGH